MGANKAVAICKAVLGDWLPWVKEFSVLMRDAIVQNEERDLGFWTEFHSKENFGGANLKKALKKRGVQDLLKDFAHFATSFIIKLGRASLGKGV